MDDLFRRSSGSSTRPTIQEPACIKSSTPSPATARNRMAQPIAGVNNLYNSTDKGRHGEFTTKDSRENPKEYRRPYRASNLRSLEAASRRDKSATSQVLPWIWIQEAVVDLPAENSDSHSDRDDLQYRAPENGFRPYRRDHLSNLRSITENLSHSVMASDIQKPRLLRWRELGHAQLQHRQLTARQITRALQDTVTNDYREWLSFGPTSKDVITAAWAPDGRTFAVGASTNLDSRNIQYNDPKNLLFGNTDSNSICELEDHHIERPRPASDATQDGYNTADNRLFTTVSSICFDSTGTKMFTASFDKTLKVWDLSADKPICTQTLVHDAHVQLVEYCAPYRCVATAQDSPERSIRLHETTDEGLKMRVELSPNSPQTLPFWPKCLRFGASSYSEHLLIAGFGENKEEITERERDGDLRMWDVAAGTMLKLTSSSHTVFDVAWHPRAVYFAAAMVPGSRTLLTDQRRTKSIIRTWKPLESPGRVYEFECEAADINQVTFHPVNDNWITASGTNGKVYLWDARRDDRVLHVFPHGEPIDDVDPQLVDHYGYRRARELVDTGVQLLLWGPEGRYLYTGSSDGVLKQWDPGVSTKDALVSNVATFDSGIMSGAFSPDFDKLLIGTVKGSVRILSSKMNLASTHETREMAYIAARSETSESENGIFAARELIASGQIDIDPDHGAVQGPQYSGPYASWARKPGSDDLDPDVLADQRAPEQWQRGMRIGGRPKINASAKRQWLLELHRPSAYHQPPMRRPPSTQRQPATQAQPYTQQQPSTEPSTHGQSSTPSMHQLPSTPTNKRTSGSAAGSWSGSRPRPQFRYPPETVPSPLFPAREDRRSEVRKSAGEARNRGEVINLDDNSEDIAMES